MKEIHRVAVTLKDVDFLWCLHNSTYSMMDWSLFLELIKNQFSPKDVFPIRGRSPTHVFLVGCFQYGRVLVYFSKVYFISFWCMKVYDQKIWFSRVYYSFLAVQNSSIGDLVPW